LGSTTSSITGLQNRWGQARKGDETMKKVMLTLLLVCMVLPMASLPAYAEPPTPVSGDVEYWPVVGPPRFAGGNTFLEGTDYEKWQGDFVGVAETEFRVTVFTSGFANGWIRGVFTGTVLGNEEGTLELLLVGKMPPGGEWYGQWVILGGTGGLANAHGQGTWGGPGIGSDPASFWYSGQVHFDP
jgi:hypothetical protein